MAEPAAKKAKTAEAEAADKKEEDEGKPVEEEPSKEAEDDAPVDNSPKNKDPIVFRIEDTTLNIMPSTFGNVLMPLSDGGFQYLLAGARANVGVKAGRYMFEAKLVEFMSPAEDPAARQKTPMPRSQLRVGFSTADSSLFLGEGTESICFDSEGAMIFNRKRTQLSQKSCSGDTLAVVLNLDGSSPNKNTISIFKNGERACPPQALPDELVGKVLHPTLTFKNLSVHYNFGPNPRIPLPFTCRMVSDASTKDSVVLKKTPAPKDGKYNVVFPVCLPDEGTFDWLDMFLQKNPSYTELSDRAILKWAELSGLNRAKANSQKTSNDKPEMGYGIQMMDDASVRRVIQHAAPVQGRNYVVMEVRSNLLKDDRKEAVAKWPGAGFKRTAMIMIGTPPQEFKQHSQNLMLALKQEVSDAEFKTKKAEEKRKKLVDKRQRQLEKERKKAIKNQKKLQEAMKKRLEDEKRKKELANKGEEAKEEEEEEEKKEEEKKDEDEEEEDEKEDEAMEEAEEEPPKAELTAEEKRQVFCKRQVPDLTTYNLNMSFTKFSIPDNDEGFDEMKFEWAKPDKCKEYVRTWIQDRKLTTRVEDIVPSEWFVNKFKEWQRTLQVWHQKQNQYKALLNKRMADKQAKEAAKAAKKAAKEKAQQQAEAKKKAAEAAAAAKAEAGEGEEKKEGEEKEAEAEKAAEEPAPMEEEEEEEEEEKDNGKIDFDKLDVFGVEDILDVGAGEPIFKQFGFEDWTMMSLRFEIHLLTHSFKRDVNDPDRVGIHADHLSFYYSKYFKKTLNVKFYGVDTVRELLEMIKDTVVVHRKNNVVEPQLPDDMESLGVFVMISEEARRDRNRRIDLGDETAKLKLTPPQGVPQQSGAVSGGARPAAPALAPIRPVMNPWAARPGGPQPASMRPVNPGFGQARPFQPAWQRPQAWRPA